MQVSYKSVKEKNFQNILDYILNAKLNAKEFPIETEVKELLNKMAGNNKNELIKKLELDKKDTGIEILYALKKEFRSGNYV